MEEIDINKQLLHQDLFELFKAQLKKDFEGSGLNGDFALDLPSVYAALKDRITREVEQVTRKNGSALASLFYRVDISERQLATYDSNNNTLTFEELAAELIVKRILQKIILRKKFSS